MQIKKFKYSEFEQQPQEWILDEVVIDSTTLIVGRNAAGKTRTLNIIASLASVLSGARKPNFNSANYLFTFVHENSELEYELCITKANVVLERLKRDGQELLIRGSHGTGQILAEKEKRMVDFQSPTSEIAAVVRRDSIQHSYLDALFQWGSGLLHFKFGTFLGKDALVILSGNPDFSFDTRDTNAVIAILYKALQQHGQRFKDAIISDLKALDYDITDIGIGSLSSLIIQGPNAGSVVGVYVQEAKLAGRTDQNDMSQGMFRALSVVVQLNYAHFSNNPSCILIDDIGEGLDYERSCALVKLLVEKEKRSGIQLVMSTNDRFVMNTVPLDYWAILHRSGSRAKFFNKANSQEKFEEFKFTGLNNFDFFATDFLQERDKPR